MIYTKDKFINACNEAHDKMSLNKSTTQEIILRDDDYARFIVNSQIFTNAGKILYDKYKLHLNYIEYDKSFYLDANYICRFYISTISGKKLKNHICINSFDIDTKVEEHEI